MKHVEQNIDHAGTSTLTATMMVLAVVIALSLAVGNMVKPLILSKESYTGTVIDEETGRPLAGAVVFIDWRTHRSYLPFELNFWAPESSDINHIGDSLTVTDNEGKYRAPEHSILRWVHWLTGTPSIQVLIYKAGYISFRNDGSFDGHNYQLTYERKKSFSRAGTTIRLTPWRDGYEHWRHLEFIYADISIMTPDIASRLRETWDWEYDLSIIELEKWRAERNAQGDK